MESTLPNLMRLFQRNSLSALLFSAHFHSAGKKGAPLHFPFQDAASPLRG